MKKIFYSLIIICSVVLWGCETKDDVIINGKSRTLQIKVDIPDTGTLSADAATRVSLNPDGEGVKVRWEVDDVIYFVFAEQGEAKSKTSITLKGNSISDGGVSASFELEVPETVADKFDLYCVHGGSGFDNYQLKVPTIGQSTASDLNGLGQNVTMYRSVMKDVNISTNNRVSSSFDHIGSLFHIKLSSIEGATLSGITKAALWSSDDIFAVQNENNNITYDPITGELSSTNYNSELWFNIEATNLAANGAIDFWGWYIPGSTENWPALGLKLSTAEGDITSSNVKPASASSYDKGKAYDFYALYNGTHLLLTDDGGDDSAYVTFIDSRDGTIYKSVEIGNQVWMAENLKYLPEVSGPGSQSATAPHYYVYGYNGTDVEAAKATENYQTYGVLYNWSAAMAGSESSNTNPSLVQGVCPDGWHLPSDTEWTKLERYLIANGYNYDGSTTDNKIAISMAEPGLWQSHNGPGTIGNSANYPEYANKSGFSAVPGGYLNTNGNFYNIVQYGHWWRSTERSNSSGYSRTLSYYNSNLFNSGDYRENGFSVRCVQDSPITSYTLTLQSLDEDMGTVSVSGEYLEGEKITIEATAKDDYKFLEWIGDVEYLEDSNAAVTEVTMPDKDISLTATFGKLFGSFTDIRDGTEYKTVKIGNQVWMAENLKYLPKVNSSGYYVYEYDGTEVEAAKATENYQIYGVLYNWAAAMVGSVSSNNNPSGVQGVCPDGWHLPSEAEWDEMKNYLIANGYNYDGTTSGNKIGIAMAESGLWSSDNGAGTIGNSENYPRYANKSGFSARPGGHRYFDGKFYDIVNGGNWWSSTKLSAYDATSLYLGYNDSQFNNYLNNMEYSFSVRCVRD